MAFNDELEFEHALIDLLTDSYGWEPEVLKHSTEKDLIENWANILFENNRQKDRLNDYPLTSSEMQQIIIQINNLRTPLKLNEFINGTTISIKRDNPDDKAHFNKEISLKIYDRQEIAAGQSRYQIVEQPEFKAKSSILPNRRGDFMLLINGMPLFHIELKKSGIPVSQAYNQIEKYSHEGVFTGLFSLVQVFVAMNPEETVYFANPGPDGRFNPDYYFHWADFNNEPINDWKEVASRLLSIPMAHQLIGFYTVADNTDGVLKVMRSYQYYAANKISDTTAKHKWENYNQRGGYVWHTTGSGKTLTSFKSALLIADSGDADKVVFLVDRIELGTQNANEFMGFAGAKDSVQITEDTAALINKLKSPDPSNTLIVTSIQKMSNLKEDGEGLLKEADLEKIKKNRIVFIVDECHRSVFGEMMSTIKNTLPKALFFGFSGTPIMFENEKKGCTTADVFGSELHRYSIADGIRDKNVLGFDTVKVLTFQEKDIREAVALEKAKANTVSEVFESENKEKVYYHYMNEVPMAKDENNSECIEDYLLKNGQYRTEEHQNAVVQDMIDNWIAISRNNKFHAIFATSSIPEAIQYYKKFKGKNQGLKVTCLFDPSIDNNGDKSIIKEDALIDIISDYNNQYSQTFSISTFAKMKKDIQYRLAHKKPYERIEFNPNEQIDLLIVVDQMLTGYDSKWVNALYLDKVLKYENIIQAFSRTNRLFGPEKPHGTIKYYRAPFTMEKNIQDAVKAYSGDQPLELFVLKLDKNIDKINYSFCQIKDVFENEGINNFEKLPDDKASRKKFVLLFNELNHYLESATAQGFNWNRSEYRIEMVSTAGTHDFVTAKLEFDKQAYLTLVQRYKEVPTKQPKTSEGNNEEIPYDLENYITTINTDDINAEYMNSRFKKYLKELNKGNQDDIEKADKELHSTFATLSEEDQVYAKQFLHDIQTGDVIISSDKTLRDYINEYKSQANNDQIHRLSRALGLNEELLRDIMAKSINEENINEFAQLDKLKSTIDKQKAKEYFEFVEKSSLPLPMVNIKADSLVRDFILKGGIDIKMPE